MGIKRASGKNLDALFICIDLANFSINICKLDIKF